MPLESLDCPNCGAPLPDAEGRSVVICGHCGSSIRLNTPPVTPPPSRPAEPRPASTVGEYGRPPDGRPERSALASVTLGPEDVKHVIQLIRDKQHVTAIQYYQAKVGGSLGEAREAIEAIEAGLKDAAAPLKPGSATSVPPDMAEIYDLVKGGFKIEAIKRYNQQTGEGLRESQTVVEGVERQLGRRRTTGRPRILVRGGTGAWLAIVGTIIAFCLLISGGCGVYLQTKPVYGCSIEAIKAAIVTQELLDPPVRAGYLVLTSGFEESSGRIDAEYFAPVWGDGSFGLAFVTLAANSSGYSAMSADLYLGGDRYELRPWGELPCE